MRVERYVPNRNPVVDCSNPECSNSGKWKRIESTDFIAEDGWCVAHEKPVLCPECCRKARRHFRRVKNNKKISAYTDDARSGGSS